MSASRRRYAELREDEYGNKPDIRFLPHLAPKKRGAPRKAIALALLLFAFGSLFLFLGALSLAGRLHIEKKGSKREMARQRRPLLHSRE